MRGTYKVEEAGEIPLDELSGAFFSLHFVWMLGLINFLPGVAVLNH